MIELQVDARSFRHAVGLRHDAHDGGVEALLGHRVEGDHRLEAVAQTRHVEFVNLDHHEVARRIGHGRHQRAGLDVIALLDVLKRQNSAERRDHRELFQVILAAPELHLALPERLARLHAVALRRFEILPGDSARLEERTIPLQPEVVVAHRGQLLGHRRPRFVDGQARLHAVEDDDRLPLRDALPFERADGAHRAGELGAQVCDVLRLDVAGCIDRFDQLRPRNPAGLDIDGIATGQQIAECRGKNYAKRDRELRKHLLQILHKIREWELTVTIARFDQAERFFEKAAKEIDFFPVAALVFQYF